jgi:DNA invertase Pin-like site-specific DNA recombinase
MPARRRQAISYSRFSDPTQGKGDSETRQERMFAEFCRRHDLTPRAEVFADRGKSGYKDEHRKKGRLGELVALAKAGTFKPGTIVVVEAWDRLGRLRPDKQTDLIAELLRTGVDIGICRLGDIFTEEDFGTHKWTTLAVFVQLAYQESKQKADRVAASWERRRDNARTNGALVTNRLPAWLELVNGKVRPIAERAAVVKRIFRMAAEGCGHTRIVKTLTEQGVPAFGQEEVREGRSRSQFSGNWTRAYVALILRDRRAMGEFQPHKADDTPEGPPLENYFPAAVSEDEFLLARAGQEERRNRDKRGYQTGPRDSKYVNLFKGLLTHARDGEGWLVHNKGTKDRPELLLVTAKGNGGRCERTYTFPYALFEEGVLALLREVDPRQVLPRDGQTASRVDEYRAKLANLRADIAGLQKDLKDGYSRAITQALREKEAEEARVTEALQDEMTRNAKPAAKSWNELPSLVDLIRKSDDPNTVRLKLRPILRQLIDKVLVLVVKVGAWQHCVVQVYFSGGKAKRDYLLSYRPAANNRPVQWFIRSWTDKELRKAKMPQQFDLSHRDPTCIGEDDKGHSAHAAGWDDVERDLMAADVEDLFRACSKHELP